MAQSHDIRIAVAGYEIEFWTDYQIQLDLLTPADAFSFSTVAPDPRREALAYEVLQPGREVQIRIDGQPIITGYITRLSYADDKVTISGQDRIWRLVKESAPLTRIARLTIQDLAELLAGDVFSRISFSNSRNRALYAGSGNRRQGAEPPVFNGPNDPRKIPLGSTKWTALSEVLRRAELLAWSSGDGREFVLGRPKFGQEPAYRFVRGLGDTVSTCDAISWQRSIEERYSAITVMASAKVERGSNAYGVNSKRSATATDSSGDIPFDMRLRLVEDARSIEEAQTLAQAAMDERNASAFQATVNAWQHAQDGRLYAPDTVAEIEDERTGLRERMYITSVTYSGSRTDESTSINLVPLGTRLVIA